MTHGQPLGKIFIVCGGSGGQKDLSPYPQNLSRVENMENGTLGKGFTLIKPEASICDTARAFMGTFRRIKAFLLPVIRGVIVGLVFFLLCSHVYGALRSQSYSISEAVQLQEFGPMNPSPQDRILVIAPHNDDETLGAGGFLYDAVRLGATVYVVLMTNGDGFTLVAEREFRTPRPTSVKFIELGYIRQWESLEALKLLGVPKENVFFLGYPDRGLGPMWHDHWAMFNPYTSRFTRVCVNPYSNSYRPNSLYSGEDVLKDLESIMRKTHPTIILTASPVDMHPDHWATYNFTLYALEHLDQNGILSAPRPKLLWYLVHRGDWPYLRGLPPTTELLPPKGLIDVGFNWFTYHLSNEAVLAKGKALRSYRSQMSVMGRYLLSFVRPNELFAEATIAPVADLPWPGPTIDGRLDDWPPGIRLMEEPVKDSTICKVEGGGDFAGLLVGKDGANLYLAINLRSKASPETLYRLHLHSVGIRGHGVSDEDIDLTFRPRERGAIAIASSTHRGAGLKGIKAASQAKTIEIAIPLELLGNPRSLFLEVESRFQGIMIDRTTWRLLRIQ